MSYRIALEECKLLALLRCIDAALVYVDCAVCLAEIIEGLAVSVEDRIPVLALEA